MPWLTLATLVPSLLLGLSCMLYVRTSQRIITESDGSLTWHEEVFSRGAYVESNIPLSGAGFLPPLQPVVEWIGFKDRPVPSMRWPGTSKRTESGSPLILLPVIGLLLCAVAWLQRLVLWRRARRGECCRHCGYPSLGLQSALCPECGEALCEVVEREVKRPRHGISNVSLALSCALFALWLAGPAMYISAWTWWWWMPVWPVLIIIGTPFLTIAAIARPRMTALGLLAGAAWWLLSAHATPYGLILVQAVRKPGVPGSSGLEPETIKGLFRWGGGALLIVTGLLAALGGGDGSAPKVKLR